MAESPEQKTKGKKLTQGHYMILGVPLGMIAGLMLLGDNWFLGLVFGMLAGLILDSIVAGYQKKAGGQQ